MRQGLFVLGAILLLGFTFLLAYQAKSDQMWGVFAFLVIVAVVIYLLVFQGFGRATLKGFGVEARVERGVNPLCPPLCPSMSFNELEQRLLRFLKEEFLEKGSRPMNMLAPATMHRDVMEKFGLDLFQYREVMARLEHHGIVQAIAIGATNGHLRIDPVVVDIVRQLDEGAE